MQPVQPMRPGHVERRTHDYRQHGTTTLFAALNVRTHEMITQCYQRHRAIEFRQTVKELRRGMHRSVAQLTAAILEYIDAITRSPRPFIWTKNGRPILASIARSRSGRSISSPRHFLYEPPGQDTRRMSAMLLRLLIGAFAALTLAACHPKPSPSIGVGNPYPVSNYVCDGTRLAVRLMGESASVSVDGAAAVDLPATGQSGTTFSNGRQTLIIEQGRASWAVGRATPVACTGG